MSHEINTTKIEKNICKKLNKASKLRKLIPFLKFNANYPNINNDIVFNTKNQFRSKEIDLDYLDFTITNGISKFISKENKSIINHILISVETTKILKEEIEEKILSHYDDTIILFNPIFAPHIPHSLKIQKNLYFLPETDNKIICIDNKDSNLEIYEDLEIIIKTKQIGIYSAKSIDLLEINGNPIKIYEIN